MINSFARLRCSGTWIICATVGTVAVCVSPRACLAQTGYYLKRTLTSLHTPHGLTVDTSGDVFVADSGNQRVVEYNANGRLVRALGGPGSGAGQLRDPVAVGLDPFGRLYVCDSGNRLIQVFDARTGAYIRQFPVPVGHAAPKPDWLAVDNQGVLGVLFNRGTEQGLATLDGSGNLLAVWYVPTGSARLVSIAMIQQGTGYYDIWAVDTAGNITGFDEHFTQSTVVLKYPQSGSSSPVALAVDRFGAISAGITGTGATGNEIIAQDDVLQTFTIPTDGVVAGLAADYGGTLYAAIDESGATASDHVDIYAPIAPRSYGILWQETASNSVMDWSMLGAQELSSGILAQSIASDWKVVAYTDLFGVGEAGIFWQSQSTGDVGFWQLHGGREVSIVLLVTGNGPSWRLVAVTDLDNDGNPDFIWQSRTSGDVVYWRMHADRRVGSGYLARNLPQGWRLAGVSRTDPAGNFSLYFWDGASGDVPFQAMLATGSHFTRTGTGYVARNVSSDWRLAAATDINGDGESDLIWQNAQYGLAAYWLLNGNAVTGTGFISNSTPVGWKIVTAN